MPRKKTVLTEEERAKRIRETAEEIGASSDPKALDKALKRILPIPKGTPKRNGTAARS